MYTSRKKPNSAGIQLYYQQQSLRQIDSNKNRFKTLQTNSNNGGRRQRTNVSLETSNWESNWEKQFCTLESSQVANDVIAFDSPSSASGDPFNMRSTFSPQISHYCSSDNTTNVSPLGVYSSADDDSFEFKMKEIELSLVGTDIEVFGSCLSNSNGSLHQGTSQDNEFHIDEMISDQGFKESEISLLGPSSDIVDSCQSNLNGSLHQGTSQYDWSQFEDIIPKLDLKEELIRCAQFVFDGDFQKAIGFMNKVLGKMVSVAGSPIQRLGAYMLEGLRARVESSGSAIYKALKCEEPTSIELMSAMHILYQICPYFQFAYISSNAVICEEMQNESRIHIIDFQIAQGSQWMLLLHALKHKPGGPPFIRVTGIDDSQSFHARGGKLDIVGKKLEDCAKTCKVPFEFNSVKMYGCEVQLEDFEVQHDEVLVVNFPFALHHIPDESVSMENHRDRLLRLVKILSPKVVLFVEQESNTNTSPFLPRFAETLNYYTAMFESIDVALPRDDKKRINAEQHCVARDIVNIIACEGDERVERHELFGKWKARFSMAGFVPLLLSPSVIDSVRTLLKDFNKDYRIEQTDVAINLAWKSKVMCTSSAWRCY